MRSQTVRVRSSVDSHILRHVTERDARLMCAEDSHGDPLEDIEPTARRLTRKKERLTDIKLLHPERAKDSSPCTITLSDMQHNAFGKSFNWLGSTDSIRAIERATAKIDAWPDEHDQNAVIISAGEVHGAILYCPWPRNQNISFA